MSESEYKLSQRSGQFATEEFDQAWEELREELPIELVDRLIEMGEIAPEDREAAEEAMREEIKMQLEVHCVWMNAGALMTRRPEDKT